MLEKKSNNSLGNSHFEIGYDLEEATINYIFNSL